MGLQRYQLVNTWEQPAAGPVWRLVDQVQVPNSEAGWQQDQGHGLCSDWAQIHSQPLMAHLLFFLPQFSGWRAGVIEIVVGGMCGGQLNRTDVSRTGTMGHVQKVSRAENPGCLAMGKTREIRTSPPGEPSSPSILLVIRIRSPDLPYCWPCSLDPPLTFPALACH